jgi:catechol 2,3-dioxygenase-like lactoylglutathione lyase family enzyme
MHSVTVFVRDQDRSLKFYLDQLGFNLVADVQFQAGRRWVAVSPPDGTAILTLVAPKPDSREYKLIGRPTQVVFVTEDVLAKFHDWRKRGVRFSSTPRLRRIRYERPPRGETGPTASPGGSGAACSHASST